MVYIFHFRYAHNWDLTVHSLKEGEAIPTEIDGDALDWYWGPFDTMEEAKAKESELMKRFMKEEDAMET